MENLKNIVIGHDINHSAKNLNLEQYLYKKVCFITKINIIPNKEFFYDYGDEYW